MPSWPVVSISAHPSIPFTDPAPHTGRTAISILPPMRIFRHPVDFAASPFSLLGPILALPLLRCCHPTCRFYRFAIFTNFTSRALVGRAVFAIHTNFLKGRIYHSTTSAFPVFPICHFCVFYLFANFSVSPFFLAYRFLDIPDLTFSPFVSPIWSAIYRHIRSYRFPNFGAPV